jgi:hypothetical protein
MCSGRRLGRLRSRFAVRTGRKLQLGAADTAAAIKKLRRCAAGVALLGDVHHCRRAGVAGSVICQELERVHSFAPFIGVKTKRRRGAGGDDVQRLVNVQFHADDADVVARDGVDL